MAAEHRPRAGSRRCPAAARPGPARCLPARPRHRRRGRHQPGRARGLPRRPPCRHGRQARARHPRQRDRPVPHRGPPARLGTGPAAGRDALPRRPAAPHRTAAPGASRARNGPGRAARQPRPRGEPRLPAGHDHPDPLRAEGLRRPQAAVRLRHRRRRRRSLPALLQPQDEARGTRPPRRRTAGPDPRPAAAGRWPLPARDRAVPPAGEEPGREDPGQQRNLPPGALPLAGTLRRPRRARPARAPDTPSMEAHTGNHPDQP